MDPTFTCFSCNQIPLHFTILPCDHLVCSQCLDDALRKVQDVAVVFCKCGVKNYCQNGDMMLSLKTPQIEQVKGQLAKTKQLNKYNPYVSNFRVSCSQQSAKSVQANCESLQMKNQKYFFPASDGLSASKQSTLENSCFLKKQIYSVGRMEDIIKVNSAKIVSQSANKTVQSSRQNVKLKSIQDFKKKHEQQQPEVAQAMESQMSLIQLRFKRQIRKCQQLFSQIIKNIEKKFTKMLCNLEKTYDPTIYSSNGVFSDPFILDFPLKLSKKYEIKLSPILRNLHQNLVQFLTNSPKREQSSKKNSDIYLVEGGEGFCSSEKHIKKLKEYQFVVNLQPKENNAQVLNPGKLYYIDVIGQQMQKRKSKNCLRKKHRKIVQVK